MTTTWPNGLAGAGFELAVAHDLFVHHFGSRTFAGNGVDAEKLLDENAGRFAAKWGLNGTNGRRVALPPFTASPRQMQERRISSTDFADLTQIRIKIPDIKQSGQSK